MESFLRKIEDYIEEKNINYGRFACNVDSLPESFVWEIISKFKKETDCYVSPNKIWLNFSFDNNGNLYMYVGNRYTKTGFAVYQDGCHLDRRIDAISESEFINGAINEEIGKVEAAIEKFPVLNKYISDINAVSNIEKETSEFASLMCGYLDWMKEYEQEDVIELSYVDPEASPTERSMKIDGTDYKDRIHEILGNDERIKVLDSFSPKYRFRASNETGTRIYNVRVYQPQSTSYRIIMDPEMGKGHIKISYQESETALSEGEISGRCVQLLQMSRDEITNDPTMTRHQHRSIEDYESLISYVVTGEGKINYVAKKNIDSAKEAAVLQKRK